MREDRGDPRSVFDLLVEPRKAIGRSDPPSMGGREMDDGESLGDVFMEPGSEQRSRLLLVGYHLPEPPLSLGRLICFE